MQGKCGLRRKVWPNAVALKSSSKTRNENLLLNTIKCC